MKKYIIVLISLIISLYTANIFAQAPESFKYQAILRDISGGIIPNQQISVQISILQGATGGTAVYVETHAAATNQFGLINVNIGNGTIVSGDFSLIEWGSDIYFVKIEIDVSGGSSYVEFGESQLLSVPYALHAKTAENVNDADHDPLNEIQYLSMNGFELTISNGNTVTIPAGSDTTFWLMNGNNIYYTNGNASIGTQAVADDSRLNVQGKVSVLDPNDIAKATIGVLSDNSSYLNIRGSNGSRNVYATSKEDNLGVTPHPDRGFIGVYNEDDNDMVHITTVGDGTCGYFDIRDSQNNSLVSITKSSGGTTGYVQTSHPDGTRFTALGTTNESGGYIGTWDLNGNENCSFTGLSGYPTHGFIAVYGDNGICKAGLYVDETGQGVVYGDVKNFRMQHPEKQDKEIWYASLEGPEVAAYLRGTSTLINGKVAISFPEHFNYVISKKNMTVILTPLSADSKGLAVTKKDIDGFAVQELFNGKGNYDFDWEVKVVRKGFENYKVIRNKNEAVGCKAVEMNN